MTNRKTLFENGGAFLLSLTVLILSFGLHPDPRGFGTHEHLHLPPCFFRWLTHLPCPTCGMTTSFAYLAHGRFLEAFQSNPLGPVLFLITWLVAILSFASILQNKSFWRFFENKFSVYFSSALIAALFITWIFRIFPHERSGFAFGSF